jgi:TfoX/Sxy family transcriptional regulator of competence genes
MAYDKTLADRVRAVLAKQRGVLEREMFGGIAFLLEGKMFCGIVQRELMVRVGPAHYEKALAEPGARPMDFTGRPMLGYVFVQAKGLLSERSLRGWVERGQKFVATLHKTSTKKLGASKTTKKRPATKKVSQKR